MAAPREGFPSGLVQRAVREGVNATDALRLYRAAGGSVRTQTWYRLYGQAKLELELHGTEAGRPLHLRPTADEIQQRTTRRARGYEQRATVFMRDRETGEVIARPFSQRAEGVVSRRNVIETAIGIFSDFAAQYDLVPEGAIYTGTFELVPE